MCARPTRTTMIRNFERPCSGSITWDVIHQPMYLCHLPNLADDSTNTLPPSIDTHVTTEIHVAPGGGCLRRRNLEWCRTPDVFSPSSATSDNSTNVSTSTDYGNLSFPCTISHRVWQRHGGKAPIVDRRGDGEIFPGPPF